MCGEGNKYWFFDYDLEVLLEEFGILLVGRKVNMGAGDGGDGIVICFWFFLRF